MPGLMDFLQDRLAHESASSGRETREAQASIARLEERVDRLTLACAAMWSLLRRREGFTEEALLEAIQEIDLRDGALDGRHVPAPVVCTACGRSSNRRHRRCMYCEAPFPRDPLP